MTDAPLQICCKRIDYSIKQCQDNLRYIMEMVKLDPYLIRCTEMKYSRWVKDQNMETKTVEVSQENVGGYF